MAQVKCLKLATDASHPELSTHEQLPGNRGFLNTGSLEDTSENRAVWSGRLSRVRQAPRDLDSAGLDSTGKE